MAGLGGVRLQNIYPKSQQKSKLNNFVNTAPIDSNSRLVDRGKQTEHIGRVRITIQGLFGK